jgi:hypothetical protein
MLSALTLVDMINMAVALLTIGLGLWAGWRPAGRCSSSTCRGPPNMAYTEVSAVSGCLFVGLGLGAMILNEPVGWVVMGIAYAGAAVGRVTAIFRDDAASRQSWTFFGSEAALASWLILANI